MGLLINGGYSKHDSQYYGGASNNYGNYQFTSLDHIITQFQIGYVGEGKIIPKIKRADIQFFAMRALQELSFDTFKSVKSQEILVPASLQMVLPRDYVNYTKLSWVDSAGIKHIIYPTSKTSNPKKYQTDANGDYIFNTDFDFNLISSGEMINNFSFYGSSTGWTLNQTYFSTGTIAAPNSNTQPVSVYPLSTADVGGEPQQGWFYENNTLRAYDIVQWQGVTQNLTSVILPGEKYKITITVSGYVSGVLRVTLIDKHGDIANVDDITANGTYTQTITAGNDSSQDYVANSIMFRNTTTAANGNFVVESISLVKVGDEETSTTWENYKSHDPSENSNYDYEDYENDVYWPNEGRRYGLDPQHAQVNGSFYIDELAGKIHFSSNISGETVILDYISDSLGTDEEMQVHKLAEEAMYKHIAYAILSTSSNPMHQQLAPRFKKERFAETRKAKLRLSNIKLEEITQILRGKSKQIKH
jgi:hypothetical protein